MTLSEYPDLLCFGNKNHKVSSEMARKVHHIPAAVPVPSDDEYHYLQMHLLVIKVLVCFFGGIDPLIA